MKKLTTIAAANTTAAEREKGIVSRETIKCINKEVAKVRELRRTAAEVIRLVKKASNHAHILQALLPDTSQAAVKEAEIRDAVNRMYPWKCNGYNMKPTTAYVVYNGRIHAVKRYIRVADYLEAMTRAAKAATTGIKQMEVDEGTFYLHADDTVIELSPDDVEGSTYAEYQQQQQEDSARTRTR